VEIFVEKLSFAAVIGDGDVIAVASTERKAVEKASRLLGDLVSRGPCVERIDYRVDVFRCTREFRRVARLLWEPVERLSPAELAEAALLEGRVSLVQRGAVLDAVVDGQDGPSGFGERGTVH
jgi:hypothetical protein